MIKLKDILKEALNVYSVSVSIISDKEANFTDILDNIRATRKVTIVNSNTSDEIEAKNRTRNDGKEIHTATMKFVAGSNPKQDLEFLKTTILSSDKGDPGMRIKGLRHIIFNPKTLTKI
jgi:hypothetical protein|tara:strand:+ start:1966 stop:2322 length:357 start_codon:yes stop_codon:yes gene_type:complete